MITLTTGELNALVSLLDDADREVKHHVRKKIISLGMEIIPFLEQKWEASFNPDIQKEIEELVHDLQFDLLKNRLKEWKDSEDRDLLEGLWILNTYQYPDLEFEKLNAELQQIYFEVWTSFSHDLSPVDQVKILNHVLFNSLKFSANTKNFHSPANSMLSVVLDTKKGNPISLCIIYMLVATRLGLPIYGVNFPNLFVLIYKSNNSNFYINAFNRGMIHQRKDAINYLEQLKIEPKEEFFEPCNNLQIILRMLRNLGQSFEKLGASENQDEVKEMVDILLS